MLTPSSLHIRGVTPKQKPPTKTSRACVTERNFTSERTPMSTKPSAEDYEKAIAELEAQRAPVEWQFFVAETGNWCNTSKEGFAIMKQQGWTVRELFAAPPAREPSVSVAELMELVEKWRQPHVFFQECRRELKALCDRAAEEK